MLDNIFRFGDGILTFSRVRWPPHPPFLRNVCACRVKEQKQPKKLPTGAENVKKECVVIASSHTNE